jgi:hypothetical protein
MTRNAHAWRALARTSSAASAANGLLVASHPQYDGLRWFDVKDGTRNPHEGAENHGAWHHVVTTVGAGGQRLHVDGNPIATGTLAKRTCTSNRLGLDLGPAGGVDRSGPGT